MKPHVVPTFMKGHYMCSSVCVKTETSCAIDVNELKLSNATNTQNDCPIRKAFAVVVAGVEVYTSAPSRRRVGYVRHHRIYFG